MKKTAQKLLLSSQYQLISYFFILIIFNSEEIDFSLLNQQQISNWITETIVAEGQFLGEISYIFCNDIYLHKINLEYLQHDTYTDIITFDYSEKNIISSDIFVSVERVKENSDEFDNTFVDELHRVLIHGILHLLGYKDKTPQEVKIMRAKEDYYLTLLSV